MRLFPRKLIPSCKYTGQVRLWVGIAACAFVFPPAVVASPHSPLPATAFDAGFASAETVGRGGTFLSAESAVAAGVENPAVYDRAQLNDAYGTVLVRTAPSQVSDEMTGDPLQGKVLRFLSLSENSGGLFFQPIGRRHTQEALSGGGTQDAEFAENAIGFAGGSAMGRGSIGVSLAYLWGSLATASHPFAQPDTSNLDTADGARLNIGLRYPMGPVSVGLLLQNFPGFLWWKDYRRDQLPVKARIGQSWRAANAVVLSAEAEEQFYEEGSQRSHTYFLGAEGFGGKSAVLRAGLYGENLNRSEGRHWTAGLSLISKLGAEATYGIDVFRADETTIRQSYVSLKMPLVRGNDR